MRFETTIQRPVEASGVGLHSGVPVSIRILPAPRLHRHRLRPDGPGPVPDPRQLAARGPRQLRHQPDAAGRPDLHHRASAQRVLQHGDRQRLRRDRQPRGADPGRQRAALRGADPRAPACGTYRRKRRYLRIRRPVTVEDKGKRISILPADTLPADLRHPFRPSAGGAAVAGDGGDAGALRRRDRAGAHLRLRVRAGPDAQHGPDPRRLARKRGLLRRATAC